MSFSGALSLSGQHFLFIFFFTPKYLLQMAGAIIEKMSTKKLVLFVFFILLFQIFSILVGALICK